MSAPASPSAGTTFVGEIDRADPMYAGERRLRYLVLRKPLGMPEGSEENRREAECRHWVAVDDDGAVIGCVLWLPEAPERQSGRLLQMAVAAHLQGQGVGRLLVEALEAGVVAAGFVEVTLHARATAIGFYERLGYAIYGEPFEEVGIPHRLMRKSFTASPASV